MGALLTAITSQKVFVVRSTDQQLKECCIDRLSWQRLSEKFEPVDEQVSRYGDFAKPCAPPEVTCLAGGRSQILRRRVDLAPGNRFQGSLLWSAPRRPARALGDLGERDFFR